MELTKLLLCVVWTFSSSAAAQVTVFPEEDLVVLPNSNFSFSCHLITTTSGITVTGMEWLLNGTALGSLNLANVHSSFSEVIRLGFINFVNVPLEYNNTSIQCVATISPPRSREESTSSARTLLVQGLPSAVTSLTLAAEDESISLNWTAPFTLDIPNTDPDITYCVDVVNSTSSATLHSECGLNRTEFTYSVLSGSGCHDHMITVMPENVVGRGEPNRLQFSQAISVPQVREMRAPELTQGSLRYEISMTAPVCYSELILSDQFTDKVFNFTLGTGIVQTGLMRLVFTSEKLKTNTHYASTLNANNVNGPGSSSFQISTFDIISMSVTRNPLSIHAEYVSNSMASGGLFIFLLLSGDDSTVADFSRSVFISLDRSTSLSGHTLPVQLPPGNYSVSAYDIEEGGLMDTGTLYPADTTVLTQEGNTRTFEQARSIDIKDCSIVVSDRRTISALCTHAANSPSSEAGFVMIVQRSDININRAVQLLVNETRQGTPMGPVSIQVEENGIYHVAIFPKNAERGVVDFVLAYTEEVTTIEQVAIPKDLTISPLRVSEETGAQTTLIIISVGAVLGVLVLLALVLGGVILVVQCRRARHVSSIIRGQDIVEDKVEACKDPQKGEDLVLTPPDIGVYAEIGDVKSSFSYTQNMLYESSSISYPKNTCRPPCTSVGSRLPIEPEPSPAPSHDHDYDTAKAFQLEAEASDPYHVKQCSAYGAAPPVKERFTSQNHNAESPLDNYVLIKDNSLPVPLKGCLLEKDGALAMEKASVGNEYLVLLKDGSAVPLNQDGVGDVPEMKTCTASLETNSIAH